MAESLSWQSLLNFILEWYWIPLLLVYVAIIITILAENRTPSKTLAYILVLIFMPVIGFIVYYLVGRKPIFKKLVFNRKSHVDDIRTGEFFHQLRPLMEERLQVLENDIGDMALPFRYLYLLRQSLISTGNKVTLLNNGEEMFAALFSATQRARHHIHLEYYILSADDVGNRLVDILIEKHRQGVEVRVIVDDVGSNRIGAIPKRLREAGIVLLRTLPVTFNSLANTNYRNHRKIAVIDGETGFIGGINLDDRYRNNGKHTLYWRDTAVLIEGPAVNLLQMHFFLSWIFSGGNDDFEEESRYLKLEATPKGSAIVSIVASGPNSAAPYIMECILLAISQAKKSVRICTPYFIPSDQLTSALVIAAASGVSVELIIPKKSDSYIVQHASFSFIKPLLERGVKVYLYNKGFLHAKTIFIDSSLVFIGTANMDTRSFFLNFEITSVIYEEELCRACEENFERDKLDSQLLTLQQWKNRPALYKGLDSVCRLIAPLL